MTLLVLMRHGEQEPNPGDPPGALFSVGDHGLSAAGIRQAEAARDALRELPLARAVASPARRAQETARIVAEPHGLTVETLDALQEVDLVDPDEQAPPYEELLERIKDAARALRRGEDPVLPSGRTISQEAIRGARAMNSLAEGTGPVLVVAHGLLNRVVLAHALGLPLGRAFDLEQDHGCIDLVDVRANRVVLRQLNAVPGRLPAPQT